MSVTSDFARDIGYVAESTFGTTPSTPTMKALRFTGGFLNTGKQTFVSEEIRSDGQIVDMRHGTGTVTGELTFELGYGAFDDWLEMALGGSWTTNVLKAGRTVRYFSVEERHTDASEYVVTKGAVINSMSLNIQPNSMVTGSFSVLGRNQVLNSSSLGTPGSVAAHPPFSSFTGTVSEGGSSTAALTGLELTLNRNFDPIFPITPDNLATNYVMGQNVLTGTATFLLEDETLINKFLNETSSSLSMTLDGPAGGDLTILIPSLKYTGATRQRGTGSSVVVSMPFQALRDASEATNIKLTRIPA